MASGDALPVLNRTEQQRHFGIDCGDAIHFEAGSWLPGGEHVKKIVVKNVSRRTIKFKYELPTTKYFSMAFPTLMTLSPGMHTTLDVAFRPVKVEEYDDFVTFYVHMIEGGVVASGGGFRLPVFARIAHLAVEIPNGLDFGFCPTAETTELKFLLRNTGQVDSLFEWSIAGAGEHGRPFAIHPSSGRARVGASIELTASFSPAVASVYVTTTVCSVRPLVNDDQTKSNPELEITMKLSGISKFTHVSASETDINFGSILVGATNTNHAPTERDFILRNRSLVHASYRIQRVETDCDSVFSFYPMSGTVPAECSVPIRVRYTPTSSGTYTCDHFDIITPGGNRERITCKGRAIGPTVSLWKKTIESNVVRTRSVNFGDIIVGKTTSRVLILRNESPIEVFYHFDTQEEGVFKFDKINGRIPPELDQNVTISFTPSRVGNFHRRFFILLQNQSSIYVDMLATSYDDNVRPSPFEQAHVDAYRLRVASGLGLLSPDQLEVYWQDNGNRLFRLGVQTRDNEAIDDRIASEGNINLSGGARFRLLTRSGEATLGDVDICDEYFASVDRMENPIVLHEAFLDFGNCNIVQYPSKKVLRVTNNTHGKVTCYWRVASGEREANAFQVFPETLDVGAGSTAEFRVSFQPSSVDTYYFAELEGYFAFKSNRTFRLVNVETFTPPWCVVSKACGNTFSSPTNQFLSKVSFRLPKQRIHFPPCYLGDCVFQTVLLDNTGDTPALFAFAEDPSQTFECKPRLGYIRARSFHLVQIRFHPRASKHYKYTLSCIINNARGTPENIELTGVGAVPRILLQGCESNDGTTIVSGAEVRLFIKPTAVGLFSERVVDIMNPSRLPLVFRWEVPRQLQDIFEVFPRLGRLNGRESAMITCRFMPKEVRAYASRIAVSIKPISISQTFPSTRTHETEVPLLQESFLRIHTKGTDGAITFEPESITFETILVSSSSRKVITIVNTADCDLQFSLSQSLKVISDKVSDDHEIPTAENAPAKLVFSRSSGCISARSRMQIIVSFHPRVGGVFQFTVTCRSSAQYDTRNGNAGLGALGIHRCEIRAEASFPTLIIEDIRVPYLPTALAWPQFLCKEINDYMSKAPNPVESDIVATEEAHNDSLDQVNENDKVRHVAVPFSPAPFGEPAQLVFFKLRNPGNLIVEFHITYPKEGNVEIEHWAETGAPSSDEIRTNAIIDSNVFQITPRRAVVLPQQTITLCISYAYSSEDYCGKHDLSVLFQVDKGKQLVLELQGQTLPSNEPKLFLSRRVIALSPVMIGEFNRPCLHTNEKSLHLALTPPRQQFVVSNRGDAAFRLDVSSNSFDKINQQDYGGESLFYPVLRCVTTSEIVAARSSVCVELEFAPLEAKTIEINLILKAYGLMGRPYKEVAMVTIIAAGFHPLRTSLPALRRELALVTGGASPTRQQIAVQGQTARFQSDLVEFNHAPTQTKQTQLLVLVNDSGALLLSVRFQWDVTHPLVSSGLVSFNPAEGELKPQQEILIRVTVMTTDQPVVIDHDIPCWITSLDAVSPSIGTGNALNDTSTDKKASKALQSQTWSSVVTKSTATQSAAIGIPPVRTDGVSASGAKCNDTVVTAHRTSDLRSYPLFAHIYAHVLPRDIFERLIPHDSLQKLPLPTVQEISPQPPPSTLHAPKHLISELQNRQNVVQDLMEMLFTDVLSSSAVNCAIDKLLRSDNRMESIRSANDKSFVFRAPRASEDCAAIASGVVENTVYNVLQELFYGEFGQELACVPRKTVFPKAPSLRRTQI